MQDVAEAHVVGDEEADLVGLVVGHAEAVADGAGDGGADFGVAVEADARLGVRGVGSAEGGRFADIVQKSGPA